MFAWRTDVTGCDGVGSTRPLDLVVRADGGVAVALYCANEQRATLQRHDGSGTTRWNSTLCSNCTDTATGLPPGNMRAKLLGLPDDEVVAAYLPMTGQSRLLRYTTAGSVRHDSSLPQSLGNNRNLIVRAHPSGSVLAYLDERLQHFAADGTLLGGRWISSGIDDGSAAHLYAVADLAVDSDDAIRLALHRFEGFIQFGFPPNFVWQVLAQDLHDTAEPEGEVVTTIEAIARIRNDGAVVQMREHVTPTTTFRLQASASDGTALYTRDHALTVAKPHLAQFNANRDLAVVTTDVVSAVARFDADGELFYATDLDFEVHHLVHTEAGQIGMVGASAEAVRLVVLSATGAVLHDLRCAHAEACSEEPRALAEHNGVWYAAGVRPAVTGSRSAWLARMLPETVLFASDFEAVP